ncbi:MAG: T9SS type A sorting domain-containing protein [Bacteroidetes bacterium]|nr:T9SS type A sorting domain-containing protein [Bacteroidota bacterium]
MKKIIAFAILMIAIKVSAQVSFIGFDTIICSSPMTNVYTYVNYMIGSHGGGYTIYQNGVQVFDKQNYDASLVCNDLIFINDNIGFIVECNALSMNRTVYKSSDSGQNWTYCGSGAPYYLGLYILNENYGYLLTTVNSIVMLTKVSDIEPPVNLIFDDSLTAEIYKHDTINGVLLCNIDTLKMSSLKSNLDTLNYYIIINSIPAGITEIGIDNPVFKIFPNPTSEYFSFMKKPEGIISVDLFGINGQLVKHFSINDANNNYFGTEELLNGFYFVRVNTKSSTINLKLQINQ